LSLALNFFHALDFFLTLNDFVVSNVTAGEMVRLLCLAGAFQREVSPQIQVLASQPHRIG